MTARQLVVLWIAVLLGFAMFLYPPKYISGGREAGYRFLWVTEETALVDKFEPWQKERLSGSGVDLDPVLEVVHFRIDYRRLSVQYGLLAALVCVIVLSLHPRRP